MHSYVIGMYTNESNVHICQMCKQPAQYVEVVEIANLGLELQQMHLCLCRNCASRYKSIRDSEAKRLHQMIIAIDLDNADEEFEINLKSDITVTFTQTHLVEIQTLLKLIDEYGLPDDQSSDSEDEVISCAPFEKMSIEEDDEIRQVLSNEKQDVYDIGTRVKHRVYGLGTVAECDGDKITILFDDGKEKTFDWSLCIQAGSITLR